MQLFHIASVLFSLSLRLTLTIAQSCNDPAQRHEWRSLSDDQKFAYLQAVVCLQSRPPLGTFAGSKSIFDDFQALHISLTDEIHHVGQFLPWHRYFITVFESALQAECGYQGTLPYWDWSIDVDAGEFESSPVFDPVLGFGGNGQNIPRYNGQFNNQSNIPDVDPSTQNGGGCVTDGPFANYTLSLGPGTLRQQHCLTRAFTPSAFSGITSDHVQFTLNQDPFENFRLVLEGGSRGWNTHDGGHFAVGGEMSNRYSSPGDPLFYLHHANLDRIWVQWQELDLNGRLFQISGNANINNRRFPQVTLDFQLKMNPLAQTVPIRNVMDNSGGLLCYRYV